MSHLTFVDEPISPETRLSGLHSVADFVCRSSLCWMCTGELRKLTVTAENCEKDELRRLKVIQGNRIWHQSKGHMQLRISG